MNELVKAALAALGKVVTTEGLVDELITAMKEDATTKPIHQALFNEGHSTATESFAKKKKTLEDKVTAAEKAKTDAEAEVAALREKTPDAATLNQQWSEKLTAAQNELAAFKEQAAREQKDNRRKSAVSKLEKLLSVALDDDFAEAKVATPEVQARISFDENDNLLVLQAGQQIPFAGDEEAQLKALAAEIIGKTKPLLRKSGAGAGSARNSTGGAGAGGASRWQAIREEAKKAAGAAGADGIADREAELDKRLGRRTA